MHLTAENPAFRRGISYVFSCRHRVTLQLIRVMKLTALLLTVACLGAAATGHSQLVTLKVRNVPLKTIFTELNRQTGYNFLYSDEALSRAGTVTMDVKNEDLNTVLGICFKNQPLSYIIENEAIVVKAKAVPPGNDPQNAAGAVPFVDITIKVMDSAARPLSGASVSIRNSRFSGVTDAEGLYRINVNEGDVLVVSHVGYETQSIPVRSSLLSSANGLVIHLKPKVSELKDIVVEVNTGYQRLRLNETTGSYSRIDNETFNRTVSPDILSRLRGVTTGILFDPRQTGNFGSAGIQIRGLYTLSQGATAQPVVVVDNFIYEGDLNDINPNDVENVTILKDAAAASIWGAKAGNGVIVISTKKGRENQPLRLSVVSNTTVGGRPDLYDARIVNTGVYMDFEKQLFDLGYFNADINDLLTPLAPTIGILARQQAGQLTAARASAMLDSMRGLDNRDQFLQYLYRNSLHQQNSLQVSGGGARSGYFFSLGYDRTNAYLKGDDDQRISIRTSQYYRVLKNLEINTGVAYNVSGNHRESIGEWGTGNFSVGKNRSHPLYMLLADAAGNPVAYESYYKSQFLDTVGGGKLLDWRYRPLQEPDAVSNKTRLNSFTGNLGVSYRIIPSLRLELNYQYQQSTSDRRIIRSMESYTVRNQINYLTNLSVTDPSRRYPVPMGSTLQTSRSEIANHSGRGQLSYEKAWGLFRVRAITGGEIRYTTTRYTTGNAYGYNDRGNMALVDFVNQYPTITGGSSIIPNYASEQYYDNRFVSGYLNGEISFKERYILTGGMRRDASNIFGVKTNEKGRPFWTVGSSWNIAKEAFYHSAAVPELRLRVTTGNSGNIDPSVSAYSIVRYNSALLNPLTNIPYATLQSLPNPSLRWEKVSQWNFAVDFALKNNWLSGSVDYYRKRSRDVIYAQAIDPTVGFGDIKTNSAGMSGNGLEIALVFQPLRNSPLQWQSQLNLTTAHYQVDEVDKPNNNRVTAMNGLNLTPLVGYNPYSLLAYRWAGLDPATGAPGVMLNGKPTMNYDSIANFMTEADVVRRESSIPTIYGNWLNTFQWKQFNLSANISYNLGYYLFKPSLSYNSIITGAQIPTEYLSRWQQPGDEQYTQVPSFAYPANPNRDQAYTYSDINMIKGDHIRLNDIRLAYQLNNKTKKLPLKSLQLFVSFNNLNLILWRANKYGIDPVFPDGIKRPVLSSLGIKADF